MNIINKYLTYDDKIIIINNPMPYFNKFYFVFNKV